MIDFTFTEEQEMFRDAYRKFLATEIVPHMEAWREAGIVDREAFVDAAASTGVAAASASASPPAPAPTSAPFLRFFLSFFGAFFASSGISTGLPTGAQSFRCRFPTPSTWPDCSSMSFWPGWDDQRRTVRSFIGASPQ